MSKSVVVHACSSCFRIIEICSSLCDRTTALISHCHIVLIVKPGHAWTVVIRSLYTKI